MKKTTLVILAILALIACNDERFGISSPADNLLETSGIKVDITITRSDVMDTKATVKTAYADNDVVYIFFKGVSAPKYLEMKYDSGSGIWMPTAKNGLTASDISGAVDKKMTAIYLPYGNTATVAAYEGNFVFSDITYSGYFLKAEQITYTFEDNVLSGSLSMTAPTLSNDSDKLIHFDISGFASGHDYKLYQDYVKPLTFTSVSADGVLSKSEGAMGAAITGYEDGSMISFSGILDVSAVGKAKEYQFTIDDLTSSRLYTRNAGTKTLSSSKYIGIGALNDDDVWKSFEYVDLGLSVKWATHNIGASTPEGTGDSYAYGEVEARNDWSWASYKWCNGASNTLTKYNTMSICGIVDNKITLDPEDDAAHVNWGGNWRMPTKYELDELLNYCTWEWTALDDVYGNKKYGYLVSSNVSGYEGRHIFLFFNTEIQSSSIFQYNPNGVWCITYSSNSVNINGFDRCNTYTVRPVCPSDSWLSSMSITPLKNEKTLLVGGNIWLNAVAKQNDEVIDCPITWSSDNPSVAVVDLNGVVTGKSVGTAHITASIRSISSQCTVTVIDDSDIEPEYVDLGFSVKWATFNVGALSPDDLGSFYAWGETEPKSTYDWSNYKWCNGSSNTLTKYNDNGNLGFVDNKTVLDADDDVANVKWGGSWRIPTKTEQDELRYNCTWTWTTLNGVNGYLITSNKYGYSDRSIFIPAPGRQTETNIEGAGSSGFLWSNSVYASSPNYVLYTGFNSGSVSAAACYRYYGQSVRPVCP